jgi:hypothetical protein
MRLGHGKKKMMSTAMVSMMPLCLGNMMTNMLVFTTADDVPTGHAFDVTLCTEEPLISDELEEVNEEIVLLREQVAEECM